MSYSKSFLGIMGLIVVLVAFVGSYGYLVSRLPSETLFVIERGVDSLLVIIGIGWSIVGLIRRNFNFFYGLMAVLVGLYFIYRGPAMFGVN